MKTQIQELVNGAKRVIRDAKHPKYANAPKATSHIGFAGTNRIKREEIAGRVFAENGDAMRVNVRGIQLDLRKETSTTGKTEWYSAEITREQANAICGFSKKTTWFLRCEGKWSFTIHGDCTCTVNSWSRRTPGSEWEERCFFNIGEEFVTILGDGYSRKVCAICGKVFDGYGNNAAPVKEGVCCDECNAKTVIPTRKILSEIL